MDKHIKGDSHKKGIIKENNSPTSVNNQIDP